MILKHSPWTVALIVGFTLLASALPLMSGGGGEGDAPTASLSPELAGMVPVDPAYGSVMDPKSIFNMAADSGVPHDYIYLPNIFAQSLLNSGVQPLYTASPAPMGITDYGYMEPSAMKIPYQYNTSSFLATVMFESLDAQYLMNNNPGTVAVQLSAVLSVSGSQGNGNSFFWVKNVLLYTPSTGKAQLVSNVWDISSPSLAFPAGILVSGNGDMIPGLMYYFAGPSFELSGENTVALYINAASTGDGNTITFQYSTGGGEHGDASPGITYDTVVLATPGTKVSAPAGNFVVDGFSRTPSGFLKDVELAVTGPGMGSTTSIYDANGQLTLKFLGPDGTYAKLPAAYNYGSNTGETVQGLSVWWSSQMKPMAHLTTGPSLPVSLWGSQVSQSGAVNMQGTIDPSNSFVFISMGSKIDKSTAAWAPVNPNGTYKYSLPGRITYTMEVISSNHDPQVVTIATETNESSEEGTGEPHGGGGGGEGSDETQAWNNFTLSSNNSLGVYTPLYANGNDQLKELVSSTQGNGNISNPYVLENNQYVLISELFTRTNNFLYPQFSGILIQNTDSYVRIDSPPSLQYKYPVGEYALLASMGLPYYNNLNMVLYNTSHVSITNASVTGWFPDTMLSGAMSNMMFLDSSDFLVASGNFSSMGSSLSIYSGHGVWANGTVWGNRFTADPVLSSGYAASMAHSADPLSISAYSNGNLIYNNYFGNGTSAMSPLHDPYTGETVIYWNSWNLPEKMPGNFNMVANGHSLRGNVVQCGYQGGNYWEYRDISILPYNAEGRIASGGDYLPLSPPLYKVYFNATGSTPPAGWSVKVFQNSVMGWHGNNGGGIFINGTYEYRIIMDSSHSASPSSGTFTVDGSDVAVNISFSEVVFPVTFTRSGLPNGTEWQLDIGNLHELTSESSITIDFMNGSYSYAASAQGSGLLASQSGRILVSGSPVIENILLDNRMHQVRFVVAGGDISGLWSLSLGGKSYVSGEPNITSSLEDGLYEYAITAPEGYVATMPTGTVAVYGGNVTVIVDIVQASYSVTFVGDGLKSGTYWQVQLGGESSNSTGSVITFEVPSGNYTYLIPKTGEYTTNITEGNVLITDRNVTINVGFEEPVDYLGTSLNILIGTVSFAAVSAVATYIVGRRK